MVVRVRRSMPGRRSLLARMTAAGDGEGAEGAKGVVDTAVGRGVVVDEVVEERVDETDGFEMAVVKSGEAGGVLEVLELGEKGDAAAVVNGFEEADEVVGYGEADGVLEVLEVGEY